MVHALVLFGEDFLAKGARVSATAKPPQKLRVQRLSHVQLRIVSSETWPGAQPPCIRILFRTPFVI
jgi:hypothetical protein